MGMKSIDPAAQPPPRPPEPPKATPMELIERRLKELEQRVTSIETAAGVEGQDAGPASNT